MTPTMRAGCFIARYPGRRRDGGSSLLGVQAQDALGIEPGALPGPGYPGA